MWAGASPQRASYETLSSTRALVPITLSPARPGTSVKISSTLRAGLSGLTKTLADQVARDGILVNALLPGHYLTDRQRHLAEIRSQEQGITEEEYFRKAAETIPLGRIGDPRELASVAAFLCSERASYLTGTSIQVDGGLYRGTF